MTTFNEHPIFRASTVQRAPLWAVCEMMMRTPHLRVISSFVSRGRPSLRGRASSSSSGGGSRPAAASSLSRTFARSRRALSPRGLSCSLGARGRPRLTFCGVVATSSVVIIASQRCRERLERSRANRCLAYLHPCCAVTPVPTASCQSARAPRSARRQLHAARCSGGCAQVSVTPCIVTPSARWKTSSSPRSESS